MCIYIFFFQLNVLTEETSRCCCGELDTDIRLGVSKFVTKYFGQLRRVSNADKRAVESMMCKWMQGERKRLKMQYNMKLDNEITGIRPFFFPHFVPIKMPLNAKYLITAIN